MRYIIGYQTPDELDSTYELVRDYDDAVSGVYFALPGSPSARAAVPPEQTADVLNELRAIQKLGKKMVLLYNANCYGAHAASNDFRDRIWREIDYVRHELNVTEVTTTSPFVGSVIRQMDLGITVCASVNMRIGSISAMRLLSDFDAFYIQRELIYDFAQLNQMKTWCVNNGKLLKFLANSGCLYACPFHTYHDNLVAHEGEQQDVVTSCKEYASPCWETIARMDELHAAALFLQGNWVRPEDIRVYERFFGEAKLATRMHASPRRVLNAYVRGSYKGNLMDIMEPAFSIRFPQSVLDASLVPSDFLQNKMNCGRVCDECNYCLGVAKITLRDKHELYARG